MTEQQKLLRNQQTCKQSVMPPHDILASLYNYPEVFHPIMTGEPGRIQQYWTQNEDLYESLGMPDLEAWLFNMFFFCLMSHFQTICLKNGLYFFWGQKFQVRKLPHVYLSDCTVMGQTPSPSNILRSLQFFRFWGVVPALWIHGCWPAPATPAKHWLWHEPKFWKLSHGVFKLFDPRVKLLQNLCALLIFSKKCIYVFFLYHAFKKTSFHVQSMSSKVLDGIRIKILGASSFQRRITPTGSKGQGKE